MLHPSAATSIDRLRVDRIDEPVGFPGTTPLLSWILIRPTPDVRAHVDLFVRAADDGADVHVWGSRAQPGATSVRIPEGTLRPLHRYSWTVRIDGSAASATFSTGASESEPLAHTSWLTAHPTTSTDPRGAAPAPELSRSVTIDERPHLALLLVAAGGYAIPLVDGQRLSDIELSPTFSDYDRRLHYRTYDLTPQLALGTHELSFVLGRGFYGMTNPSPPPAWEWEKAPWHDEPCVAARLELVFPSGRSETIITDRAWRARRTQTVYDDLYAGEVFDVDAGSGWEPALVVPGPRGRAQYDILPPIRVVDTLAPVGHARTVGHTTVFDFGRVVSGRVRLRLPQPGRHRMVITHGEKLDARGLPNIADGATYFTDGFQTDVCTLLGPTSWAPQFTYHGFRYVGVTGWPADEGASLAAEVLHSDLAVVSSFACSEPLLNDLHDAVVNTLRINIHGIPTDTPTYEKNGWTGDGMLAAEMMLVNLDSRVLLEKWLDDIVDTIDDAGRPQVIAPSPGWGDSFKPSPTWHSGLVLTPWWLYEYGGDDTVLRRHYDAMRTYVLRELADSDEGIVHTVLNDWCSPETGAWGGDAPDDHRVSGTAYLFLMLRTMTRIAETLGRDDDRETFADAAAAVADAFHTEFFDSTRDRYAGVGDEGYRQTHNVLALAFGLVPPEHIDGVVAALVADIRSRDDHLNTGVLGTKYLLPVLTRHGHADLAFRVATRTTFPSFGLWIADGSKTLWEHWRPESRSRAHYMFGTYDDWLIKHVLGIAPASPGFREIHVRPADIAGLEWAEGSVPTPTGPIDVRWERVGKERILHIAVPYGAVAHVQLAAGRRTVRRTLACGIHAVTTD